MNRREAERQTMQQDTLLGLGFTREEAESLRRISMTLHRWHELECGVGNDYASWSVERDEVTNKPYMVTHPHSGKSRRSPIADRETGALKRLAAIIQARNARNWHPIMPESVATYIQTDPRGAALYLIRPGDVPEGKDVDGYYSRGICVY